jgi:hypothetical protein
LVTIRHERSATPLSNDRARDEHAGGRCPDSPNGPLRRFQATLRRLLPATLRRLLAAALRRFQATLRRLLPATLRRFQATLRRCGAAALRRLGRGAGGSGRRARGPFAF